MGRKDVFVQRCIDYCRDDSHGYSQTNDRFGHPDFDCSGLIYQCAIEAGYNVPKSGTRYTGTMLDHFRAAGFTAVPFDGNVHDLEPGDIALNVANHVEMCVMPGYFGGAHIDEHGRVSGGTPGDQTGNEVSICPVYVYSDGWDWILTPPDDDAQPTQASTQPSPSTKAEDTGVRYCVQSDGAWNDDMVGERDTGGSKDTWGGELGVPATMLAVKGHRYRVMTVDSFPDWLPWVDKFDKVDEDEGCAGDGSHILMVQVEGCKVDVHRNAEWNGVVDGVRVKRC